MPMLTQESIAGLARVTHSVVGPHPGTLMKASSFPLKQQRSAFRDLIRCLFSGWGISVASPKFLKHELKGFFCLYCFLF